MSSNHPQVPYHRVRGEEACLTSGTVRYAALKSLWFSGMAVSAVIGGASTFSWPAFALFLVATAVVLLFGHSLGSHRKLIHNSYECPVWLEYVLVYLGVQAGLAGPLGILRQHELRDYAQRLPDCHAYLRHGSGFWRDAWWQIHCALVLVRPPHIRIEERIAANRFYLFLERTWMAQQLPWAVLFYLWGGWGFVFWGVCARVAACVLGHWLIGYFAHNHGAMHFEVGGAAVQGRNIRFTSLLTMGECWHNNHHAFPASARLGLFTGEWDPGWWALTLLAKCGAVWALRTPEQLPSRPELIMFDVPGWATLSPMNTAAPISPGIAQTIRMFSSLVFRDRVRDEEVHVRWPGSLAPYRLIRLLCGGGAKLTIDRGVQRMTVHSPLGTMVGLPGLLAAIGRRSAVGGAVALPFLPAALALENARSASHSLRRQQ